LTQDFLVTSPGEQTEINSVYFGGGTPSILTAEEIKKILDEILTHYHVSQDAEVTLEANPDDLTKKKIKSFREAGINRLSIGVQSFSDDDLKFMNRVHNSDQAIDCVKTAGDSGFNNISIDLIYGTPGLSNEQWIRNLHTAFALNIHHLSCYSLTVEPQTTLAQFIKKGKQSPLDELKSVEQFELLMQLAGDNGYQQYEISNFAKDKMYSIHNSNYWRNEKYLGLGPSAHSYNRSFRQWNVSNNTKYIQSLFANKIPCETEELTSIQRFNEYILTSVRTMWGCNLEKIREEFGESIAVDTSNKMMDFSSKGFMENNGGLYTLTNKGKLFSDKIAAELFQD
jgi:oxygen-independent coproporphyrinogen-3 oxidase